ncbi:MAG: GNAT family N-acetyltransferase [Treponema sp.]|nr:GNAT family N-acetyltransferase [Treponema sp.]
MVASIKDHKSATNPASHIKTSRLELVPQSMAFLKTTHAYAGDRENMRFMLHLPNDSEEATQEFLDVAEKEWKKVKPAFFEFAILKDGKHIGGVSVHLDKSRTSGELGWAFLKLHREMAMRWKRQRHLWYGQ